jgi:hypothetical protein
MAYSRYRLRGKLLDVLERMPETLTPQSILELTGVMQEIATLHKELALNPFEYVAKATKAEHCELSQLFAQLLALVSGIFDRSTAAFLSGAREFTVDSEVKDIRDQLAERAKGQSATSMLLAKFFKGGELRESDDSEV